MFGRLPGQSVEPLFSPALWSCIFSGPDSEWLKFSGGVEVLGHRHANQFETLWLRCQFNLFGELGEKTCTQVWGDEPVAYWLGALDLLFVQRASDGKEVSLIKSELLIHWDKQSYDAHVADGIRLIQLLELAPAASQLRIVVRDRRSGKLGSVSVSLDRIHLPH